MTTSFRRLLVALIVLLWQVTSLPAQEEITSQSQAPAFQFVYDRAGSGGLAAASVLIFLTGSLFPINAGGAFDFNHAHPFFVCPLSSFECNRYPSDCSPATILLLCLGKLFVAAFAFKLPFHSLEDEGGLAGGLFVGLVRRLLTYGNRRIH